MEGEGKKQEEKERKEEEKVVVEEKGIRYGMENKIIYLMLHSLLCPHFPLTLLPLI